MKMRWLVLCDKNGVKTEPELQYLDEEEGMWLSIEYIEIKVENFSEEEWYDVYQ